MTASVVLLRGVNVDRHRRFQPSELAKALAECVNVRAAVPEAPLRPSSASPPRP